MRYCFIGVESEFWSIETFQAAAASMKAHGYDTVAIKMADGPNLWYADIIAQEIYAAFKNEGLHPIPYMFCYGNTQGSSVSAEANVANHILGVFGEICLDMESGFDNRPADGQRFASLLNKGIIHISTWANPVDHNWLGVLQPFLGLIKSVWPQVYTNYLLSVWEAQYSSISIEKYPTYTNVTLPANTLPMYGYWEYQSIMNAPNLDPVPAPAPDPAPTPPASPTEQQDKEARDCWASFFTALGQTPPPTGSGIFESWLSEWIHFNRQYGPPITHEYPTNNWDGTQITAQEFAHARCEWVDGAPNWYSINGKLN